MLKHYDEIMQCKDVENTLPKKMETDRSLLTRPAEALAHADDVALPAGLTQIDI